MHRAPFTNSLARMLTTGVVLTLAVIPFHAFLTVWLSQIFGHYTALRLWKECLLALLVATSITLLFVERDLWQRLRRSRLVWLVVLFVAVQLVWGMVAYAHHQVTLAALGYGWIVDNRFLLFFLVALLAGTTGQLSGSRWQRLVFWPSAIVVIIGLLQYFVLPYDVLKHFGYRAATIFPYEDINHNTQYIRVMSVLRGANPLGAYLVAVLALALTALGAAWRASAQKRWLLASVTLLGLIVLVLTFSRGAWLGLVAGVLTLVAVKVHTGRLPRSVLWVSGALVVVGIAAVLGLRQNPVFQNVFWHTETDSAITTTSNAGHVSALQQSVHDVLHEPLGRGPGTAGPAAVYNTGHSTRIAENFFLQIGQETGWLGLALFLAINGLVGWRLWQRRADSLALGLFVGLIGLSVVNCFSHAWADDTLAYLWWGLAGIALAAPVKPLTVPKH